MSNMDDVDRCQNLSWINSIFDNLTPREMPGFKEATREWFRSLNVNIHTSLLYLTIFAQLLTIGSTRCLMGNLRMCLVLTAHIKTPSLQQRWFSGLKKFWESVLNVPKTLSCSGSGDWRDASVLVEVGRSWPALSWPWRSLHIHGFFKYFITTCWHDAPREMTFIMVFPAIVIT